MIYEIGGLSCFNDYWGAWIITVGIIILIGVFAFPIYTYKLFKDKLLLMKMSFLITVIFLVVSFGAWYFTQSRFKDFTPERWQQYPRQRVTMIEDLKKEHNIIGMNKNNVIDLLGEPYETTNGGALKYSFDYGYIEVLFSKGKVTSLYVVDSGRNWK